ncbi:MAG: hypothetical protein Q9209_000821 [Squamulea sp. 1 TL-2023]
MKSLKIIVYGGGCAGPSLAFWLARAGYRVTIVERFPALRATGAQIYIREQGIEVIKHMGLLDTLWSIRVGEDGMSFVDVQGRDKAAIMANTSGKGVQSMASEYEIMRGDLIRILYNIMMRLKTLSRPIMPPEVKPILAFRDDSEELRSMPKAPLETQKQFWSQKFKDVGWRSDRFIQGMQTTKNFYCQEVVQIRTNTWSKGRVVLLADAAHYPAH